jgi:anti-sigma28 factor (negative regulator of flagellin synthesis)
MTEADLLATALRQAKRAPGVRVELVARYKRLIERGRYHPDPQKIAERMIRKGLLKDL